MGVLLPLLAPTLSSACEGCSLFIFVLGYRNLAVKFCGQVGGYSRAGLVGLDHSRFLFQDSLHRALDEFDVTLWWYEVLRSSLAFDVEASNLRLVEVDLGR